MNLDDFKEPWQRRQRDLEGRVDHVIKKVRSRMSGFDRTIWFRDMRESFVAVLLFVWCAWDLFQNPNWLAKCGAGLGMLACILIVAVMYWAREKGKTARNDLPVEDYCKVELERVDRQIWLLRKVHWWYLGPLLIAIAVQIAAVMPDPGGMIMFLTFMLPFFGFIYWLNQVAVRTQLLPLRQELDEAINGDSDDDPAADNETITPIEPFRVKRREMVIAVVAFLAVATVGAYFYELVGINESAPKVSLFTEMRFEEQQIVVTYEGKDYQWLELDGIKVETIVAAAKRRFWGRWQKRVREDLVDVLWGMDHQPDDTVSLLLRDLETGEERVVEQAPMTTDNRFSADLDRVSDSAPKVSPFTEVRFEEQQIIVTYEGQDYEWLELDGIKVETIVAAAKKRFRGSWQKRVSEDLVDVLWGMDHQPGDTVSLLLRDLETSERRVVEEAPMTKDNRNSVYRNR